MRPIFHVRVIRCERGVGQKLIQPANFFLVGGSIRACVLPMPHGKTSKVASFAYLHCIQRVAFLGWRARGGTLIFGGPPPSLLANPTLPTLPPQALGSSYSRRNVMYDHVELVSGRGCMNPTATNTLRPPSPTTPTPPPRGFPPDDVADGVPQRPAGVRPEPGVLLRHHALPCPGGGPCHPSLAESGAPRPGRCALRKAMRVAVCCDVCVVSGWVGGITTQFSRCMQCIYAHI